MAFLSFTPLEIHQVVVAKRKKKMREKKGFTSLEKREREGRGKIGEEVKKASRRVG